MTTDSEWQPIETAPHDGTPIIALIEDEPVEVRWAESRRCMLTGLAGGSGSFGPGWEDTVNGLIAGEPTHWMPLGHTVRHDTTPARVTLADLIEQHKAVEAATCDARRREKEHAAIVSLAFQAADIGHSDRHVDHEGERWYIDEWNRLGHWKYTPRPEDYDTFPVPNARDVEVPAECLKDHAEAAPDRPKEPT